MVVEVELNREGYDFKYSYNGILNELFLRERTGEDGKIRYSITFLSSGKDVVPNVTFFNFKNGINGNLEFVPEFDSHGREYKRKLMECYRIIYGGARLNGLIGHNRSSNNKRLDKIIEAIHDFAGDVDLRS